MVNYIVYSNGTGAMSKIRLNLFIVCLTCKASWLQLREGIQVTKIDAEFRMMHRVIVLAAYRQQEATVIPRPLKHGFITFNIID